MPDTGHDFNAVRRSGLCFQICADDFQFCGAAAPRGEQGAVIAKRGTDREDVIAAGGGIRLPECFIDAEIQRYLPQMQRYRSIATEAFGTPVEIALYFSALPRFEVLP